MGLSIETIVDQDVALWGKQTKFDGVPLVIDDPAGDGWTPKFPTLTDRSRTLAFHECPRRRFYGYEYLGTGVRLKAAAVPLITGTYVHEGLACLLLGKPVEEAVQIALEGYMLEVESRGIQLESIHQDKLYIAYEQKALIEALLRAYAIHQLPILLKDYVVLEVEREEVLPLSSNLIWQARLDALLMEKAEGNDLHIMSFKTAASFDKRTDAGNRHDMQGISEAAAVNHRIAKWWHLIQKYIATHPDAGDDL